VLVISIFLYYLSAIKRPLPLFLKVIKPFLKDLNSRANNTCKIKEFGASNYDASHIYKENLIFTRHIRHLDYDE